MTDTGLIKVLLVEDDEDDHIIVRDLLSEIPGNRFAIEWAKTFEAGLAQLQQCQHDVCLVDYRLGARNGMELLQSALDAGYPAPIILLTGARDQQLDLAAMRAGAADYLVKGQLRADSLGRSLRYALQRQKAAALAAFEQARLASFGAEIGLALTRRDSLDAILQRCAEAMVRYLNAGLAQISVLPPGRQQFEPHAMAGPLCASLKGLQAVPNVELDLGPLAEGKPVWIKQALKDPRITDRAWAQSQGVASYAAFPLALEDNLVGLMSIFTQQPAAEQITQEMGSVAHGIALCIQRKWAEEALDQSEFKYRSVVESIKEVIFQLDEFGHWSFLNPAWETITGFEVKRTLGTFFLEYCHPENREQNRHVFLKLVDRQLEECRYETRFVSRKGDVLWVELYFQPILDKSEKVIGLSGTLTDVTDMQDLEAQFRHVQKLESVGQLAAGVAHDFNNILTVIQGHSERLLARESGDAETGSALKQISLAAQRAAALTRQLLLFSRKQVGQPKLLDLNMLLQNLVSMLGRLLGEDIALEHQYAPGLPATEADPGMLEQVVVNLAVNARDAMPKGGRLQIVTGVVDIDQSYVNKHAQARAGRFICLSMADNGCGMDAHTLTRIFEPFFTTKEVGKGTGLGLATVYGIVQQHRGWIEVTSEPNRGTTFKIYLPPAAAAASPPAEPATALRKRCRGNETILVVEDELMLREMVREVLGAEGYRIIEATSGIEALQNWDKHEGKIDLLLSDLNMPEGLGGTELAFQLRNRKPDLKILFSSGYSAEVVSGTLKQTGACFLPKPYHPQKLVQLVRQLLDAPVEENQLTAATKSKVVGDRIGA